MKRIDRLPAVPLIASDPYISYWMPADTMTERDSIHWCGPEKPVRGTFTVDGKTYRFLGKGEEPAGKMTELKVLPTKTEFVYEADGAQCRVAFVTPALPDDFDVLSMPVTIVTVELTCPDGMKRDLSARLFLSDRLVYDGDEKPVITGGEWTDGAYGAAWCGQTVQRPLCHSGDHITIDWGYLYLAAESGAQRAQDGLAVDFAGGGAHACVIAYDDIASINYFGRLCNAWYMRNGMTVRDAIRYAMENRDALLEKCRAVDERVIGDAKQHGDDYVSLVCAAYRHTFAAHKLIATPKGDMALLSKENDSNGCIGTVDVSYPSIPLFLKYAPELVNALARPVLEFANMDVWKYDFAPHDVGRYPYATGQVYAAKTRRSVKNGETHQPYYLFPASADAYDDRYQMPVEECGNMLVMLEAAREYGADPALADAYKDTLKKWVRYLIEFGEDPGEQLCTDDFAGHLAHNVNLAMKAIVGVACYARLAKDASFADTARDMAGRLLKKIGSAGDAPLTLDGQGWSMKYNLLWDRVLSLGLFPEEFYRNETNSYLKRMNRYGLPLDSRADYTKSDWICWTSAMAPDEETRRALLAPVALYLRESESRVPFSDWYFTSTGLYRAFIARSVQGGVFAPMLVK